MVVQEIDNQLYILVLARIMTRRDGGVDDGWLGRLRRPGSSTIFPSLLTIYWSELQVVYFWHGNSTLYRKCNLYEAHPPVSPTHEKAAILRL